MLVVVIITSLASSSAWGFGLGRREVVGGLASVVGAPAANAVVYLDPARYGDQELKNAAIAKCRTRVREAILKEPGYASRFFLLAVLDGLSYDEKSQRGGPDASVAASVQLPGEPYARLREALEVLTESQKALKRTNALTLADLIALSGAEAVAAVGGPEISIQLGRTDSESLQENARAVRTGGLKEAQARKVVPAIDLTAATPSAVKAAFARSGLTERESTALLGTLAILESLEEEAASAKAENPTMMEDDRGKFKERGKIGRGRKQTAKLIDLYGTNEGDEDASVDRMEGDIDDFFIADAFGSRKEAYGKRITTTTAAARNAESNFNQLFVSLNAQPEPTSWAEEALLADPNAKVWVNKYSTERLTYLKDLSKTFYRTTQLGAQYTGGKYAALLDNKPPVKLN
ncbi:hypothetical protein CTAYLR_002617 [Chrysophaeum taylorii]|uniref:Plant heme peroxidase family profile domain-containing protein n=1 Tax=Chrysophaeum taylorii TaxID=2483200 RepID=A0AAD7UEY5_9STRA|nr:hypothetical protein CTAYLR_002617 [Chrysophaeum taylorii]